VLQPEPQPFRVLYIEDSALVREITGELLERESRRIVAVGSGEEALAAFKGDGFDIVITDISLPAMSGIDLARKIQELAPSMPIILASGYALDLEKLRLGARVRAIRKPFDILQLDGVIEELCGSGSA
jgi:two-component system cell cycle response regulator CpdR